MIILTDYTTFWLMIPSNNYKSPISVLFLPASSIHPAIPAFPLPQNAPPSPPSLFHADCAARFARRTAEYKSE